MAEAFQPLVRNNFSGGVNSSASPYAMGENQVLRLSNLLMDETGSLYSRDGAVTIDQGQAGTLAILTLYDLVKTEGTVYPLAVRRSGSGQFLNQRNNQPTGTPPWVQLGTFTTQYDLPTIYTYANRAIIAAGYELVRTFDGTTFGSLTANTGAGEVIPPGARHAAVHLGYLWLWNTAATTNATDGPSSLRMSGFNNPNSWPLEYQTFINSDDGQQGQGLATFSIADTGISPQSTLVVFKDFSTYTISGVFGAANFAIDKAKTDLGCIAPRSIQFISSKGVIRLTHRGFAIFDGAGDTLLSEPIRPYLFQQRTTANIDAVDWSALHLSTATQVQNPPLYICACPLTPEGTLVRVFVYDLLRQAWTILTYPVGFATVDAQFPPGTEPLVLAGERGGGRVQRLFSGDSQDDGVDVAWSVRMPPTKARSAAQRLYLRRALLTATNMRSGMQVVGRAVFGPASQQVGPRQRTAVASVATVLVPTAGIEGDVEAILSFDVGRSGTVLHYEFEGAGPITIREVMMQAVVKPLTRPMRL